MVKLSTLVLAIASTLPALIGAASCTDGLVYCGYNLQRKGMLICPASYGSNNKND